ncbi:MAG: archaemetzincin family Zn-dependent metalloprotease [Candidatus Heimdallarchaeota archaeon]|nr:archaemetzincin family Zn-dependent metalloprotease [Candidatus Heimdallarchaeota archaeon]
MASIPSLLLVSFSEELPLLSSIQEGLSHYLKFKITIISRNEPTKIQKRGNQKYATDFLPFLERLKKEQKSNYALGLINDDLYVPELNFVFGVANRLKQAAIISFYRLQTKNSQLFLKRILTEAVHELGHLFSLNHCHNPDCVMFFSNSLIDTDRKGFYFCPRCSKLIKAKINHKIS